MCAMVQEKIVIRISKHVRKEKNRNKYTSRHNKEK